MSNSIWTVEPALSQFERFTKETMISNLGINLIEVTDNSISGSMPVDYRTKQPYGVLHGGASAALAETLGSFASQFVVAEPDNQKVVGIELNINHLSQATSGQVIGTAIPIKLDRRLHVWQIDIRDEEERHISRARLTVMVIS